MLSKANLRGKAVDEIRSLLIGPRDGEEEVVKMRMTLRYFSGILFPYGSKRKQLEAEADESDEGSDVEVGAGSGEFSGDADNPLSLANESLPSSVGITFCINNEDDFTCEFGAAFYSQSDDVKNHWKRSPLPKGALKLKAERNKKVEKEVLDGRAELSMISRPSPYDSSQNLVTLSLTNLQKVEGEGKQASQHNKKNIEKRLYQVTLKASATGAILPYVNVSDAKAELEDKVLDLQYSFNPTFAAAHGSSVNWKVSESDPFKADEVWVDYMPHAYVYSPEFGLPKRLSNGDRFNNYDVLKLSYLADKKLNQSTICKSLIEFCDFYGSWISTQGLIKTDKKHKQAKEYLLSEMKNTERRMREGVSLLKSSPECFEAFQIANYAMQLQMEQRKVVDAYQAERSTSGGSWPIPANEHSEPVGLDISLSSGAAWRPFQLAFFLLTIADLENVTRAEHQINDLIWFSTGGGKTEAYLLLAAYELIRRRLRYSDPDLGAGTGVITRYTLRFLTADQFARTSSLVLALEKIRRRDNRLGKEPFSLGLFVGGEVSYNNTRDALEDLDKLREDPAARHKFPVEYCQNCGTEMLPSNPTADEDGEVDTSQFGVIEKQGEIKLRCPNSKCEFSSEDGLPIETIDNQILKKPSSILLGTIDKFATLAFSDDSSFFGVTIRNKRVPPTLVIQDELHLISGPLGTIAAIYESAFETVIRSRQKDLGMDSSGPKYISSSATVREAHVQVRRLMGRDNSIFPPRGIMSNDSFFARDNPSEEYARLYLGLMSQGLNTTSSAHWASAALLQAVRFFVQKDDEKINPEELDFLWTLVIYCNSKRELGLINASVEDEITQRLKVYADIQGVDIDDMPPLSKEEISSDKVESISAARSVLQERVTSNLEVSKAKDVVPATNMMSVGIDISRLGLMLVNGQPKTTAEYIQASSRVGRSPDEHGPGLVFSLYSHAKPRDRSHYESFKAYHESLYRLVEPTSITPGSKQALKKAIHAAIVITLRHSITELRGNQSAKNFDRMKKSHKEIVDSFRSRLINAYGDNQLFDYEVNQINQAIDDFLDEWESKGEPLQYKWSSKGRNALMRTAFQSSKEVIEARLTMQSMRSVDVSLELLFKQPEIDNA